MYGLTSQMRRAVISIPSNIAEGYRRKTTKDYENFVRIAFGSASELETQLIIAETIGYLTNQERLFLDASLQEVLRLVNSLASALRKNPIRKNFFTLPSTPHTLLPTPFRLYPHTSIFSDPQSSFHGKTRRALMPSSAEQLCEL